MVAQSTLLTAAVATNVALGLALLYLLRDRRRTKLPLAPSPPAPPSGPLTPYLDRDYVPPLPQPVADALDRSCLCFLATAGSESERVEPHLSLMRFTYTSGLDPNDDGGRSEVVVISTQRKTKKFDILTRNENVALLVHDFTTHREGEA